MKYYIIMDDLSCGFLAKSKKDMIDYIKMNYKSGKYDEIENIKDIDIFYIKFNSKKNKCRGFFWRYYSNRQKRKGKYRLR